MFTVIVLSTLEQVIQITEIDGKSSWYVWFAYLLIFSIYLARWHLKLLSVFPLSLDTLCVSIPDMAILNTVLKNCWTTYYPR